MSAARPVATDASGVSGRPSGPKSCKNHSPCPPSIATETGLFWLYAAFGIAVFLFLHRKLPETKGRTLEEIDKSLRER